MLEKLTALKEDFFSLKSKLKILVLTGMIIILLGGIVVSISYLSKSNKGGTGGAMGTTTSNTLQRPDWAPKTRDICGDGICGITEGAGPGMCSKDCVNRPLAIDTFTATPLVVNPGQTAVLSWSSTASFCASSGIEDAYFVTGGSASGSVHTAPLQLSKTYTLSCMNNAGELQTKEVTVMVKSPTAKPIAKKAAPTITFTATPSAISAEQSTTLFWIVANANSCSAGGGALWGWIGARGTKGTQVTPALTFDEIYTLTCRGDGGSTTKSVKVVVNKKSIADGGDLVEAPSSGENTGGLGPYITFSTSPSSVNSGGKTTISWSARGAASCVAGGDGASWGWGGTISTSGEKETPPLIRNQNFAITCTGAQGDATTENASVKVAPPRDCLVGDITVQSGSDITMYKDAINALGSGKLCTPETRHCEDGTLSGSYVNPGCISFPVTGKDAELDCGGFVATFQGLENCTSTSCKWYGDSKSGYLKWYENPFLLPFFTIPFLLADGEEEKICTAILDTRTNLWSCKRVKSFKRKLLTYSESGSRCF